jgi:hypothetical protein
LKILLDECTPRLVKTALPQLDSIKNGDLLALAAPLFDVFVTADRRLPLQERMPSTLAVVVLPTNRVPLVRALLPELERVVREITPGVIVRVPLPDTPTM